MLRFLGAAFAAFLLSAAAVWADGPIYPPPPQTAAACAGGNSVLGYTTAGSALVCGTALASGSIANGSNQIGVYTGLNTIGPLTPGGDVAFSNPNFSVNSLRGGSVTIPNVTDTLVARATTDTLINKTISGASNTLSVRANLDLTGTLAATNFPALTGAVTTSAGSLTTALAAGVVGSANLAAGAAAANIGALSGDLLGNLPSPTVIGLQGRPLSFFPPSAGQVYIWNGSSWAPGTISGGGGGVGQLSGDVIGGSGTPLVSTSVVAIGGKSVQLAGPFTTSGANSINLASTSATNVTLPTSGTLMANALPSGSFFVGNASGVATPVSPNGDVVSITPGGTFSLATVTAAGNCTNCNVSFDAKGRITAATNGTGGGGGALPGGAVGSLQTNATGSSFGGLTISPTFTTNGGTFDVAPVGGALTGTLPNPGLVGSAVVTAMGAPSGDLGGASYATPKVVAIQGSPVSATPPTSSSQLVWNGSQYVPTVLAPGLNQLQGDVVAGPGSGLQSATIQPGTVSNAKLAQAPAVSIKANPTSGPAAEQDISIGSTLQFTASGSLQIAPTGVASQCIPVNSGTSSLTISTTGQVISYVAGVTCGAPGNHILADNGTDRLAADDVITDLLLAETTTGPTPCALNLGLSYNSGCNFISQTMLGTF